MAVECYSGVKYAERPVTLIWQGQRLTIKTIERQWQELDGPAFCVRTIDGQRFELHYNEHADTWLVQHLDQPPPT